MGDSTMGGLLLHFFVSIFSCIHLFSAKNLSSTFSSDFCGKIIKYSGGKCSNESCISAVVDPHCAIGRYPRTGNFQVDF